MIFNAELRLSWKKGSNWYTNVAIYCEYKRVAIVENGEGYMTPIVWLDGFGPGEMYEHDRYMAAYKDRFIDFAKRVTKQKYPKVNY